MKLLRIRYSEFSYKLIEALVGSESVDNSKQSVSFKNVTVLYTSVEANDTEQDLQILDTIVTPDKHVVVYPYAHLTRNLANMSKTKRVISAVVTNLQKRFLVDCAPVGWLKKVNSQMSELPSQYIYDSRYLTNTRLPVKLKPTIFLTDLKGQKIDANEPQLIAVIDAQTQDDLKTERSTQSNVQYVNLVGAYSGQPALKPSLATAHERLVEYAGTLFRKYNFLPVKTPIIWSMREKAVELYFKHFPNRQFVISEDQTVFRIATCLGMMKLFKTAHHTATQLPIGYYEIGTQYRKEQKGELKGLQRLSVFTMTDLHLFCQAADSFKQLGKCLDMLMEAYVKLGITPFVSIRYVSDFRYKTPVIYKLLQNYAAVLMRFVVVEEIAERTYYWYLKLELSSLVDGVVTQLGTIQIDDMNGKNLGLEYGKPDGGLQYANVIHCSPLGSIERILDYYIRSKTPLPPFLYHLKLGVVILADTIQNKNFLLGLDSRGCKYKSYTATKANLSSMIKRLTTDNVYAYTVLGQAQSQNSVCTIKTVGRRDILFDGDFDKAINFVKKL